MKKTLLLTLFLLVHLSSFSQNVLKDCSRVYNLVKMESGKLCYDNSAIRLEFRDGKIVSGKVCLSTDFLFNEPREGYLEGFVLLDIENISVDDRGENLSFDISLNSSDEILSKPIYLGFDKKKKQEQKGLNFKWDNADALFESPFTMSVKMKINHRYYFDFIVYKSGSGFKGYDDWKPGLLFYVSETQTK